MLPKWIVIILDSRKSTRINANGSAVFMQRGMTRAEKGNRATLQAEFKNYLRAGCVGAGTGTHFWTRLPSTSATYTAP